MIRCAYFYTPEMFDEDDKFSSCEADAAFTCCNFGGPVCSEHKCRCSKPLTTDQLQAYEREQESLKNSRN